MLGFSNDNVVHEMSIPLRIILLLQEKISLNKLFTLYKGDSVSLFHFYKHYVEIQWMFRDIMLFSYFNERCVNGRCTLDRFY